MSVIVIGGDRLGNIKDNLKSNGFDEIKHITGRKSFDRKVIIPENMDLVLVLTDFISHKTIQTLKSQFKKSNAKILYAKRSWIHIERTINDFIK
ncbi:DUF2325 domain-containing protein [Clostridium lundense]|uniref:DUF2325 domain-containing protein n=1 Tax=Clostridium lundense TaxID=319475 RepID=UPI000480A036|nr:DUF2325 domain-containing protein [Clostridium lundense]